MFTTRAANEKCSYILQSSLPPRCAANSKCMSFSLCTKTKICYLKNKKLKGDEKEHDVGDGCYTVRKASGGGGGKEKKDEPAKDNEKKGDEKKEKADEKKEKRANSGKKREPARGGTGRAPSAAFSAREQ